MCYLLTDEISLYDCLYFSKFWVVCVLQLFVKVVRSWVLKLTFIFLQGSYNSGKSGKTWKKLFAQGEPGKLRENLCLSQKKIRRCFLVFFMFILFNQTPIFLRMSLICLSLAKTPYFKHNIFHCNVIIYSRDCFNLNIVVFEHLCELRFFWRIVFSYGCFYYVPLLIYFLFFPLSQKIKV